MTLPRPFIRFSLFFFFSLLLLEGQTSLTLSPLQAELTISPGKTKREILAVGNSSPSTVKIKTRVESWLLKEDGTPIFPPSGTFPYSCQEWIKLDSSEFSLEPGENRLVSLTISVPDGTAPGQYWASLSFETSESEKSEEQSGKMMIKEKVMAAIFVMVGEAPAKGEITGMRVADREGQKMILISLKNSGRSFFTTSGQLEIKDENGKKVIHQELPEEMVLPSGERDLEVVLEKELPPGTYLAFCSIKLPSRRTIEFRENLIVQ